MSAKPSWKRLKVSYLICSLLFFQAVSAQDRYSAVAAVADERSKALKKDVVVLVGTKDTVVYQKDTKLFNAQRGQAELGQASQWLTAALVMILVDEGKISLNDRVGKHVPAFASYGKSYLTIGQCLAHLSGIQSDQSKMGRLFEKKKFESLEALVNDYAKKEIQNNAGEAFRYNAMGPDIAGRVLEVVTKKRFDMLIQQRLLRPLGMRQTTFGTLDGSAPSPSSGARGAASDYMRFLRMLLNNGMHNGQRILSEQSVAALRSIFTNDQNRKSSPEAARGWEYTMGAWSLASAGNTASVLAAPSFEGTTALVDFCRGYALIYLQPELSEEARVPAGMQMKEALDAIFPATCK